MFTDIEYFTWVFETFCILCGRNVNMDSEYMKMSLIFNQFQSVARKSGYNQKDPGNFFL